MTKPTWWDGKIGLGNVVSWLIIITTAAYAFGIQSQELRAIDEWKIEAKREIAELKTQRQADRETVIEMRGDIRVIRQILEGRMPVR
jgi:hypothetical protein